jgi:hypothetical protein
MRRIEPRRRVIPPRADLQRKTAPERRRSTDRSLEQQAEQAAELGIRGNVNVARMLTPAPTAHVDLPLSPGAALPGEVREDLEHGFGADLGEVRIHTDPVAAGMVEREGARAFTAGRDIYFAQGAWDPASGEGRKLLYHEIAHVLQQTGRWMSTELVIATAKSGGGPIQAGLSGRKRHG